MKITAKFVDNMGVSCHPLPFTSMEIVQTVSVTYYPNNDPEDDSDDELEFTYRVKVEQNDEE